MGAQGALGFKEQVDLGNVKLENAIRWHLTGNHYPPIPVAMVTPAMKAIAYANEGRWDVRVHLPSGILYKGKYKTAPVSALVESLRLDSFLDEDEDI